MFHVTSGVFGGSGPQAVPRLAGSWRRRRVSWRGRSTASPGTSAPSPPRGACCAGAPSGPTRTMSYAANRAGQWNDGALFSDCFPFRAASWLPQSGRLLRTDRCGQFLGPRSWTMDFAKAVDKYPALGFWCLYALWTPTLIEALLSAASRLFLSKRRFPDLRRSCERVFATGPSPSRAPKSSPTCFCAKWRPASSPHGAHPQGGRNQGPAFDHVRIPSQAEMRLRHFRRLRREQPFPGTAAWPGRPPVSPLLPPADEVRSPGGPPERLVPVAPRARAPGVRLSPRRPSEDRRPPCAHHARKAS